MPGTRYEHISQILKTYDAPGKKILEVGCGRMQYRSRLRGEYFGLDREESRYTEERPSFIGYMENMPVPDASFDLIFGVATFYYSQPAQRTFDECFRVLRPGGSLLIFDYDKPVLQRLEPIEGVPINVWDFLELKQKLQRSGFPPNEIQRITDRKFHLSGVFSALSPRRSFYHLKRVFGASDWLIVKAAKAARA